MKYLHKMTKTFIILIILLLNTINALSESSSAFKPGDEGKI